MLLIFAIHLPVLIFAIHLPYRSMTKNFYFSKFQLTFPFFIVIIEKPL